MKEFDVFNEALVAFGSTPVFHPLGITNILPFGEG